MLVLNDMRREEKRGIMPPRLAAKEGFSVKDPNPLLVNRRAIVAGVA